MEQIIEALNVRIAALEQANQALAARVAALETQDRNQAGFNNAIVTIMKQAGGVLASA